MSNSDSEEERARQKELQAVLAPTPPKAGMRATHVGSSYIISTARAAGNLSELGVLVGSSAAAHIFEGELHELEQALTKLTYEANLIWRKGGF